jgi:hypothetical protein
MGLSIWFRPIVSPEQEPESEEQIAYFERVKAMNLKNPRLIGLGFLIQKHSPPLPNIETEQLLVLLLSKKSKMLRFESGYSVSY